MAGSNDRANSWQGVEVDAFAVEHALADLIRQLRPSSDEAPHHPIPRARVLTLVVRTDPATNFGTVVDEVSHIADCHPLRALLVRTGTRAPAAGLDASAAIECVPRSGTPATVCLERIQLALSDAASDHLSSVVAPLLIPDLPVVLWWLGNLPRPDDSLLDLSGNLVVDSDTLDRAELPRLARLIAAIHSQVNVRDRAWAGLGPGRDILAELFDPPPARPYQRGVTSLRITHGSGAIAEPLLLLGWLASRLRWTFTRAETGTPAMARRIQFESAGGPVEATLTRVAEPIPATESKVVRIEIDACHAGHLATFGIARQPDDTYRASRSAIPGLPPVSHPVALTRPPLVDVLSHILAWPREDEGYRDALSVAALLAAA